MKLTSMRLWYEVRFRVHGEMSHGEGRVKVCVIQLSRCSYHLMTLENKNNYFFENFLSCFRGVSLARTFQIANLVAIAFATFTHQRMEVANKSTQ